MIVMMNYFKKYVNEHFIDQLHPPIETIRLSEYVTVHPNESVLDIGCGTGYIALSLAMKNPECEGIMGIDIIEENISKADEMYSELKTFMEGKVANTNFQVWDINRNQQLGNNFNCLVCNPPFFGSHAARQSPNHSKAIAHRDDLMTLPTLFNFASRHIQTGGRFYMVFPTKRMDDVLEHSSRHQFQLFDRVSYPKIRKRSGGVSLFTFHCQ